MFDFVKRLFGEGKIRVRITTTDGRVFTAVVPYLGAIEDESLESIKNTIRNKVIVDHNLSVESVDVLGIT